MLPQNLKTLKDVFSDDPETLKMLELREQTELLRQLADKKVSLEGIEQIKGDKGESGQPGDKGEVGEKGEQGESGIDGKDGKDGRDGVDGVDGKDGRDGIDGSSVSIDETRTLLSELLEDIELGLPKKQVEALAKKHATLVHDKLSQSIATLRGDVMRNYGGHGGSGGGTTLKMEIPVGTVDGVNVTFTVSHDPQYIEVSGQQMVSDTQDPTQYGYTYAAPTVTFVNPPTQTAHSWYNS